MYFRYPEHIYTNNQPETKVILKELTRFVKISQLLKSSVIMAEHFFLPTQLHKREVWGEVCLARD